MATFTEEEIEKVRRIGNEGNTRTWLGLYDGPMSKFDSPRDEEKIKDHLNKVSCLSLRERVGRSKPPCLVPIYRRIGSNFNGSFLQCSRNVSPITEKEKREKISPLTRKLWPIVNWKKNPVSRFN
jgi:hypothetical protein